MVSATPLINLLYHGCDRFLGLTHTQLIAPNPSIPVTCMQFLARPRLGKRAYWCGKSSSKVSIFQTTAEDLVPTVYSGGFSSVHWMLC
jgi:hypothetical protein